MSRRSLPAAKAGEAIVRKYVTTETQRTCLQMLLMVSAQAQRPGAVSDAVTMNSEVRKQGQMQIRQRRLFRIFDMPSAFEGARASARKDQRNIPRIVCVLFAHSRSIDQGRVIQQRAIAVRSRPHL